MNVTRAQLEELTNFTLENDHVYYAARMAESAARISLDSYERLFRSQYGGKVNAISGFLSQARSGSDVDASAFKMAYDRMTSDVDSPWQGRRRILFFSFPREWTKGQIDGIRYIEDEIYALYTSALDYLSARKDRETAEADLRRQIADAYEALVTAGNSADSLVAAVGDAKTALARVTELNKLGKADFSEVEDKQADYQELQVEAIKVLADYNDLLFDFERLTCGGLTKLLTGAEMTTDAGGGGISRLDNPTYYIYSDVADMIFGFGVHIPEDYEPEIDAFELWYQGVRLGERTPVEKEIRHLVLDYGETNGLTVRLYNGDEYVDECEVDTTVSSDVLKLRGSVPDAPREITAGYYTISVGRGEGADMTEIELSPADGSPFAFYRVVLNGEGLLDGALVAADRPFRYLSIFSVDMSDLRVELFDEARTLIYSARFDPGTMSLIVSED
jgi:hypothetical protein